MSPTNKFENILIYNQLCTYSQEYSDTGRNKQLEHFLQMSLLHQSEKSGSNGSMDQMQIQHQQQHFISQFQRNVSLSRSVFLLDSF